MTSRDITENFMEALKDVYFSSKPDITAEFLRGECRLLSFLNLDPKKKYLSGELARILNATTPRIAATLNSLEKKGFITRTASADDKRKTFIKITKSGSEYIESKRENICNFFDDIFSRLGEEDSLEFIRLIKKMKGAAEQSAQKG